MLLFEHGACFVDLFTYMQVCVLCTRDVPGTRTSLSDPSFTVAAQRQRVYGITYLSTLRDAEFFRVLPIAEVAHVLFRTAAPNNCLA